MKATLIFIGTALFCVACGLQLTKAPQSGDNGIEGAWNATQVKDTIGSVTRECKNGSFTIDQTATLLIITERKFECAGGAYNVTYEPLTLEIRDGELFYLSKPAGDIGKDYIDIDLNLSSTANWRLKIRESGGQTRYTESTSGGSSTTAIVNH